MESGASSEIGRLVRQRESEKNDTKVRNQQSPNLKSGTSQPENGGHAQGSRFRA